MYFVHYDDPMFEAFGGLYVPYTTQEEAQRQVANDLRDFANDPEAIGFKSIFEAEMGSHKIAQAATPLNPTVYDYNEPTGHLDPDSRNEILDAVGVSKIAVGLQDQLVEEQNKAIEDYLLAVEKAVRTGEAFQATVPGNAYTVCSGGTSTAGAIALTAATAKTVIGVASGTTNQPAFVEFSVSFDGVSASAVPVLVEMVSGTNATNAPGTASTSMTPKQTRGWPAQASQHTAAYAWSSEPTVLEVYKKRLLTPNGGLIVLQNPLGREPTGVVTASTQFKFMGYRLTAPANVNCHTDLEYEE